MSKLSKLFKEFFYAWGDNDPKKEVWRYGKYVSLERLHGYDDFTKYRPRRQMAGTIILIVLSIISLGFLSLIRAIFKKIKYKYYIKRKNKKISSLK